MNLRILNVFPGANVHPPAGYEDLRVPPVDWKRGDVVLLGGRIRRVRQVRCVEDRIVVSLFSAGHDTAANRWVPLTGALPLPIWRQRRVCPSPTVETIPQGAADAHAARAVHVGLWPTAMDAVCPTGQTDRF